MLALVLVLVLVLGLTSSLLPVADVGHTGVSLLGVPGIMMQLRHLLLLLHGLGWLSAHRVHLMRLRVIVIVGLLIHTGLNILPSRIHITNMVPLASHLQCLLGPTLVVAILAVPIRHFKFGWLRHRRLIRFQAGTQQLQHCRSQLLLRS
jgi:hypothetical protein